MKKTAFKHIKRVLPRKWDKIIKDPRRCYYCWKLNELMTAVMHALVSGCRNLRELEFLSELKGKRIPDTTVFVRTAYLGWQRPYRPLVQEA